MRGKYRKEKVCMKGAENIWENIKTDFRFFVGGSF